MKPLLRFAVAALSLLGVLVAAAPARAHGAAVSRFVVSIGEHELAVRANLHLESALELMEGSPELAHTGEGQAAIARQQPRILRYLHEHLKFRSNGTPCVPRERPQAYGVAEGALYVRVDLAYDCAKPTSRLSVTSTLFEELEASHYIEGEFHAGGVRRVYPLSNVRSAVAIDPSSFHDKPYRGEYVPVLNRGVVSAQETGAATSLQNEAIVAKREPELPPSRALERADLGLSSNRDDDEPRGFITHVGWCAAALALVFAVWHVQRTRRKGRSQERERGRRKVSRSVTQRPAPVPPNDSNQAVSG